MVIADEELSQSISQLTNSLFSVFGATAAIAAATQGIFPILYVPLLVLPEVLQEDQHCNRYIAVSISIAHLYGFFSDSQWSKHYSRLRCQPAAYR